MSSLNIIKQLLPLFYLCFTVLSLFILFKLYSIKKDKKLLSIVLISLIFSIYLLSAGIANLLGNIFQYTMVATYFSWLQEATVCFIIIGIPYIIKENLLLNLKIKKVNRFVFLLSVITTSYILLFSIIKPETFIYVDSPLSSDFIQGVTASRGETGYLFSLRDIVITLLFIYGFIITLLNYSKSNLNEIQRSIFIGFLIVFIFSISNLIENITGKGWYISVFFQFDMGITISSIIMFVKIVSYIVKRGVLAEEVRQSLDYNQKKLIYNSRHMKETKLLNREVFVEDLNVWIKKKDDQYALIFIKIINYNEVYEFFGNDISKHILMQISYRLQNILLDSAVLYHIDTDEFVIKVDSIESEEYIKRYTEIIRSILIQRLPIKDDFYFVDVKLGVIFSTEKDNDINEVLNSAYSTLNNAEKEIHKILFFNEELKKESHDKFKIINYIQWAFKHKEFYFVYQPVVSKSGNIEVMEALLRWSKPYSIDVVIDYAEKSGLMYELGMFTFLLFIDDIQKMRRIGIKHKIYFNISPVQLVNEDFGRFILGQIEKYNLSRDDIGFEITESMMIVENCHFESNINLLMSMGFELVLDDFGKGYSSLSYLYKLPVNKIKIDKDFLVEVPMNKSKCNLVNHIVSMAKDLKYEIVIEGVETKEQLDFVKKLDLEYYQGYYFYRPIALSEVLSKKEELQDFHKLF